MARSCSIHADDASTASCIGAARRNRRTISQSGPLFVPQQYPPQASNSHWPHGGEGGIRTLGTLARTTVFETAPFDRSGTSPSERPGHRPSPSYRGPPQRSLRRRLRSATRRDASECIFPSQGRIGGPPAILCCGASNRQMCDRPRLGATRHVPRRPAGCSTGLARAASVGVCPPLRTRAPRRNAAGCPAAGTGSTPV